MLRHIPRPSPAVFCAQRGFASEKNWFLKLIGYYGEESTRLRQADSIFQSCANQSSRKAWMSKGRGRVPDEFRPKHALLMTHIWLVHRRLDGEGEGAKDLQEALFDRLWEDTSHRIRATGISELMVNKSLGDVQKYSVPLLLQLDQAMAKPHAGRIGASPDEDEQADHLGAAVWRNVWLGSRAMTVEHCMEMAAYLQRAQGLLAATEAQAVTEGRIDWGAVPSWKGVKSVVDGGAEVAGALANGQVEEKEEEEEEGEWREALANTGKKYFWNVNTRETRWEKPE